MKSREKLALAVAAAISAGGLAQVASATDIYYETWGSGTINPTNYTIVNTGTGTGSGLAVGRLSTNFCSLSKLPTPWRRRISSAVWN